MAKRLREARTEASLIVDAHISSNPAPKKRKIEKTKPNIDTKEDAERVKLSKDERRKLKKLRKLEVIPNGMTTHGGDSGNADETQELERADAKAARKAEKARAKADQLRSPNDASRSNINGIHPKTQEKAKRKAERKAEEDRTKAEKRTEKDNLVDGHAEPLKQNGIGSSKPERSASEPPFNQGYQQDPDLTAFSETEIRSFLSSNFISIKDPSSTTPLRPITKFSHLPKLSQSPAFSTFKSPTPIQASAWPFLFSGRDVIGVAETGSGKTLAFGIPCIRAVSSGSISTSKTSNKGNPAKALIISPTRELAVQIHTQISSLASAQNIHTACLYGGVPKPPQQLALETAHIIVATPGRLNDLIEEGSANLSQVKYLVLDEADRMLEKGFEDAIRKILSTTPSTAQGRQTLMFTATWPESVRELAATFMQKPVRITIGENNDDGELRANTRIEQRVEVVDPRGKETRMLQIIKQYQSGKNKSDRILVFCLYKKEATRVENFLQRQGCKVAGIHGDLSQSARMSALEGFKSGQCPLLVATDVAARGLDIPSVRLVLNVTFPLTVEDYVHRIGRTGRAGAPGLAITLFTEHDKAQSGALINVLKAANQPVPKDLLKFGTTVKKKGHEAYGNFYKDTSADAKAATKIRFD
ncbi:MAG: hypothetical protein Q9218_002548 [Villophora microphyllina]